MIVGYTSGVFDLFHVGHVNLLRSARNMCDRLIVGVSSDELVAYKHKQPVIPYNDRIEVVRSCRYVDSAIPQVDIDKFRAWERLRFDKLFVGDDWYSTPTWNKWESSLRVVGVSVHYLPYTGGVSSTLINQTLMSLRDDGSDKSV